MRQLLLDEQFPISVQYMFSNQVTELANGDNQIVALWQQPLAEYDVSRAFFDRDKLDYILDFFDEVTADNFLYLDPCDNFCNNYWYEAKTGIFTAGKLFLIEDTTYQLCKVYRAGGKDVVRPITRPVDNDDFAIASSTSHTVDFETGRVIFPDTPTETELFWQGQFLVLVTLSQEDLTYQIESNNIDYSLPGLRFKEVRESDLDFGSDSLSQSLSAELDLDLIVASQVSSIKKISPMVADSGWYKASQLWQRVKTTYKTAEKTIAYTEDVEAAIALYRVSIGGAIAFKYQGKSVNIKDSPLRVTAESDFSFGIGSLDLIGTEGSILDALDGQTYLVPIVDSSGSMNADIPNVVEAINALRPLVQNSVYGGSQTITDKYFKEIQYLGDEQWVDWLARDYRDDPSEPDKVVILAWINESDPVYHSSAHTPPTTAYQTDIANFLASYQNREVFSAAVYAVEHGGASFVSFQNHLIAAHEGTDGYTPGLKDYAVAIRPDLQANTPASFYLQDLFNGRGRASNFICRCWSIEPKSIEYTKDDYGALPILPPVPEELDKVFVAYIFGEYTSARFKTGDYDCGDKFKWRSQIAIRGETFRAEPQEDETGSPYRAIGSFSDFEDFRGDSRPWRTICVGISEEEFDARITIDLGNRSALRKGSGCNSSNSTYPQGYDFVVLDVIPTEEDTPSPPVKTTVYFKLGQCEAVNYGFKAQYSEATTAVVGSILGKINSVRVYLVKEGSDWAYTLSVENVNGTTQDITLQKLDGTSLLLSDAPVGIFQIEAVRLDGQVDECGNLDGSNDSPEREELPQVGFTNHDRAITFDNINFLPRYGGNAQARQHTEELASSDNTQTTFIFSTEAISYQDLLDGKYNGARFTEWLVNWDNPDDRRKLACGYLGRTTTYHNNEGGLTFQVEMRSLLARLQQKNYFLTIKLCPKTFGEQGNGKCRKNLFGHIDSLEVIEVIDSVTFRISSNRGIDNFYGELTFTSGNRVNVTKLIDSYEGATGKVTLRNSIADIAVGDKLEARQKCDKTLKACLDFDNAVNFGGFWHVPGVDKARRTDR